MSNTTNDLCETLDNGEINVVVIPNKMTVEEAFKTPQVQAFIQRIYIVLTIQLSLTCGVAVAWPAPPSGKLTHAAVLTFRRGPYLST